MSYRFPFPPYPIGWFRVLRGSELARVQIRSLRYFGRELVAFRNADGQVAVLDAHCPHLGQGRVQGNAIECVFHGWRYDIGGACIHAPGLKKIPPRACARTWPVAEINGHIMVWHHPRGDAPTWQFPTIPELSEPTWHAAEGPHWPRIRTHVFEFPENGMDLSHFSHLHRQAGNPITGPSDATVPVAKPY